MGSTVLRILQTLIKPSGFAFGILYRILNPVDPLASVSILYLYSNRYSVMLQCWDIEPGSRPSFSDLVKTISTSLEEMSDYLHVGAFTDLDCITGEAEHKV